MALFRKCCWCGVRRGSICAAIFSMLYLVLMFIICFKMHRSYRSAKDDEDDKDEESNDRILWLYYVTFIFSTMIFIASMLVIRGILDDRRDSRMLLMPFIVLMSIFVLLQLAGWIQILVTMEINILSIVFVMNICFCLFVDLCVVSQYQELKDGRGTKVNTSRTEEPMYIAVSDRMTLPFSRGGSEGAAMYTANRVPSPELTFDNSLNPNQCMGSKSVEPSRRWTSIDYDYPIRPQSSAAGSYVQNLGQQDAASTHTESTFFFPITSTGGGIDNNDEPESENTLAIVPSAPSECGSFTPVGRALSYPSTPANNTPYLSATMNRRSMVETRASSRSLSHLEVSYNQQPAEYFGVRRLVSPPQYHTLSPQEKVESIV